jgi:hypothetical protein
MTPDVAPHSPARPRPGNRPLLVALGTLLAWHLLALAGWCVFIFVVTRSDPDRETGNMVAALFVILGVGVFFCNLLIGGLLVALLNQLGRSRRRPVPLNWAVGYGTAAAAVGLAPFVFFVINVSTS